VPQDEPSFVVRRLNSYGIGHRLRSQLLPDLAVVFVTFYTGYGEQRSYELDGTRIWYSEPMDRDSA